MPFAEILTLTFAAAVAVAFAGALISGFAGFGLNLVMVPILAVLLSPVEAVPVVTILGLVNAVRMLGGTWRLIDRREVLVMGLVSIVTVPVGAWLLVTVDAVLMRRLIAGVVIVFTLVLLAGWRYRGRRTTATHAAVGAVCGILNSGVGIGGPPVVLYQLARDGDPSIGRANLVGFFTILAVVTIVSFTVNGAMDGTAVWRGVLLAPAVLLGTWIGMRHFNATSAPTYRRITLGFLLVVSAVIVVLG
jgi:uncharacterized membrane protein YfcA